MAKTESQCCHQVDRRYQHKTTDNNNKKPENFYKKSQQTHRLPIERIRFRRLEARTGTAFTAVRQTHGPIYQTTRGEHPPLAPQSFGWNRNS